MANSKPIQTIERPGHYDDPEDGVMVEAGAATFLQGAEIDMQIATARRFPRSLKAFRDQITEMATLDEDTARSCIYVLPRDGKNVEGPSARFAEILVSCWGNNRTGGRVVDVDDNFVTGQGFFFDLEKNTSITYEVKRSIQKSNGQRFSQDMIMTTGNAATSIAHRNAALKGIPKALWSYAFEKAKAVVAGNQETLSARRVKMLKDIMAQGATKEQIFGLVGVKGIDDINLDHMVFLGGVHTAIKEGGTTVEEAFSPEHMKNPDQAHPKQPSRSEFKKEDTKASGYKKSAPKEKPKPAATQERPKDAAGEGDPRDLLDEGDAAEKKLARETERQDFIKDAYAELELQTKIIDNKTGGGVSPLRDRIIDAGVLTGVEQQKWEAACDAKNKEIMAAAKGNRK